VTTTEPIKKKRKPGRSATAPNGSDAPSSKPKRAPKPKTTGDETDDDFDDLPNARLQDCPDQDKPPPTPQELKRGRIFEIAKLMVSGEWRSNMAKRFAKLWELEVKTVQHYSAEASRLCDFATGQRETLVKIARVRLLEVLQQDESDRVPAARTLLEHLGELRQHHVVQQADPFEGWSEAEMDHFARTEEVPERFRGAAATKK